MTTALITQAAQDVLRYQRGEITISQLLPLCRPTLRKISYFVADKFQRRDIEGHRENMANDLFQDLQFWLWQKIAVEFDPEKGALESLLIKYAQNIAKNKYMDKEVLLSFRSGETVNDEFFDRGGNASEDSLLSEVDDAYDLEQQADQQLAMQKILAIMARQGSSGLRAGTPALVPVDADDETEDVNQPDADEDIEIQTLSTDESEMTFTTSASGIQAAPLPIKRSRGGKHEGGPQYTLTDDQKVLREIMKELRLKQPEMANALGIPGPRFSSYIYGRTDSVPEEVMINARGLQASGSLAAQKAKSLFDGKEMNGIMDGWQKAMGWYRLPIDERDKQLAEFFAVATVTPRRWRSGKNRPDDTTLVRYQMLVDDFKDRWQA